VSETGESPVPQPTLSAEERELGMDSDITRRDFLNAVALGTGVALLGAAAPSVARAAGAAAGSQAPAFHPWTGYGGVGDYAISNGNTWEVVNAGHGIRDNLYQQRIASATDTGETYDLVIVGGGFAGVTAAFRFLKETKRQRQCLMLENHPIIGGEAKRNEFLVRGVRLMGPQGSNGMRAQTSGVFGEIWQDVGLPTHYEFGDLPPGRKRMEFPLEHYFPQLWWDNFENNGYYFDSPKPHWVTNPFAHRLEGTPWPEEVRRDLLRWREQPIAPFQGDDESYRRWLDTMSYDEYVTKHLKLHPEVSRFVDPIIQAGWAGAGADCVTAVTPTRLFRADGFIGLGQHLGLAPNRASKNLVFSFPGGNDGAMRAIVKWLNPEVIEGSTSFPDVHNGRIRFEAMDRPNTPCRMRAGATVVHVAHDPEKKGQPAVITYVKGEKLYSVRARTVVWAGASWSARHAIQRLPAEYSAAMESFPRAPILSVNLALDNWRALYQLGYSSMSWRGGFGFTASIRAPMYIGDYRPPLDPDQPTVLTFYTGLADRGSPPPEQGKVARAKLFATSYREYETQIRQQLVKMLGMAGFDPKRDIAGIVLNRWGHAYVYAAPGFYYGVNGKPAPSDVLRQPLGNVTFGHSELAGLQSAGPAVAEGNRAATQALAML